MPLRKITGRFDLLLNNDIDNQVVCDISSQV